MKSENKLVGRLTEAMAAEALKQKGFEILEQNFSNKFGEIDIIAQDRETLVFVEVKAKTGDQFGLPEEMITAGKLGRIRHMASIYTKGKEVLCRIDVVAIVLDEQHLPLRLTHYENVC
jgi:putative endonuclease